MSNADMLSKTEVALPARVATKIVDPIDRFGIIDTVTAVAVGSDRRDWMRVRSAFSDEVTIDYTSLLGGEVARLPADDLVAQWAKLLPRFDRTLHLVTNHTITAFDGTVASAEADFQAMHSIGQDQWTLSGHYLYQLIKSSGCWTITSLTMIWTHETGDRGLLESDSKSPQRY